MADLQGGERAVGLGAMANAAAGGGDVSLPGGVSVLFAACAARLLPNVFEPRELRALHDRDAIGFACTHERAARHVEFHRSYPVDHIKGVGGAGGGVYGVRR